MPLKSWRPGRDGASGSWRPGKGRAVSSTALAGCGRGRDGRVCGECGGILAGGTREGHGSLTDVRPRHTDGGNVTLPPVFSRRCDHVTRVDHTMVWSKST